MFSWRDSQAHLLHALPAALSIGLPLFTPLPTLPGAKQPPGLWTTYQLLAAATLRSLLSVVLAVVLPAAMGIARVLLSGGRGGYAHCLIVGGERGTLCRLLSCTGGGTACSGGCCCRCCCCQVGTGP